MLLRLDISIFSKEEAQYSHRGWGETGNFSRTAVKNTNDLSVKGVSQNKENGFLYPRCKLFKKKQT